MSTENPVFQILTTTGDQDILDAGMTLGDIAVGQIGFFNYHTGLSVDGSVPANTKDIFLAVGLNTTGAGGGATLEDHARSAGQLIQTRNARFLDMKPYTVAVSKIVEVAGFIAKCDSDYAVKIEFRNSKSYGINGYNQFTKTFDFHTGCCTEEDCVTCPQGDCNELAIGLAARVNLDTDALVVATLFSNILHATVTGAPTADGTATITVGSESFDVAILDADTTTGVAVKMAAEINSTTTSGYKATNTGAVLNIHPKSSVSNPTALVALSSAGGTGITMGTFTVANETVSDTDAYKLAYPGACLSLRLTTAAGTNTSFNGNIPIKYYNSKETDIIVSLVGDTFECNGTVTTTQELAYQDGNGYEMAELEYEAGGWNGKPGIYRTSSITGLQRGDYNSTIDKTANYTQIVLGYDQDSVGGWLEYKNNLQTIIAIPCADTNTLTGFFTVSDLIFTQFGGMTDDAAAVDCTNVATTELTTATDGIESLA